MHHPTGKLVDHLCGLMHHVLCEYVGHDAQSINYGLAQSKLVLVLRTLVYLCDGRNFECLQVGLLRIVHVLEHISQPIEQPALFQ